MSILRRFALFLPAVLGSLILLAAAGAGTPAGPPGSARAGLVEVVVTLPQPSLAEAVLRDRGLAARTTVHRRLDVRATASVAYLRTLAVGAAHAPGDDPGAHPGRARALALRRRPERRSQSQFRPGSSRALRRIPGATVWPSVTYHAQLNRTPALIGATTVWGPTLATAGQGVKIGIIDDGLDQSHVFFSPSGFAYPAGFPKGNAQFTTPKVIVAKAFAPLQARLEVREHAVRPRQLRPCDERRRASPPATTTRPRRSRAAACAHPASRRARTSATTRC